MNEQLVTPEEIIQYWQIYTDKFFEEMMGIKLMWYQKLYIRMLCWFKK